MRKCLIFAVVASSVLTFGVASAQSPGASPTPGATATATPPAGPIYKGRPCGVGTLIHDFLVIQEPPPGPQATLDRRPHFCIGGLPMRECSALLARSAAPTDTDIPDEWRKTTSSSSKARFPRRFRTPCSG